MATVSAEDIRQDADTTVSDLCSNFPTAVQVSYSESKNEAPSSTPAPLDANSISTSTTGYHSVLSESSVFHTALQGPPPSDQAPAVPPMDASSASASACATQYYSARIQSMIEHRAKGSDDVEYEIANSKVHWSTVDRPAGRRSEDERELDEDILKANRETMKDQRNHYTWGHCFKEDEDRLYERGKRIAKGGEATIYAGIRTDKLEGNPDRHVIFKVFPSGFLLGDIMKIWAEPAFMTIFNRATMVQHVMMLPNDGRIAMVMRRAWGDLRTLIDWKMVDNVKQGNQGPPFPNDEVLVRIFWIAREMRWIHSDEVVHRDLKASNVLLYGDVGSFSTDDVGNSSLSIRDCLVSDYECALGVRGTGFWRAPEVLLGMRNPKKRCSPTLFTKKGDVYSYAMVCYEIATGLLPFQLEGLSGTKEEQDLVINGLRPSFPDYVDDRVKDLITRCWHRDEDKRPTFTTLHKETDVWYREIKKSLEGRK